MRQKIQAGVVVLILLTGCGTTKTPEQMAEERIADLQAKCEVIEGTVLGPPLGPKELPYRLRLVLMTDQKVIWAVAKNREKWEVLEWIKNQLLHAQTIEKAQVRVCGRWLTDEYFEIVKGYDFEFTSITFWMPDAGPAGGRYITVRTNYGDTLTDEIKENWWDIFKGLLKKGGESAKKAVL